MNAERSYIGASRTVDGLQRARRGPGRIPRYAPADAQRPARTFARVRPIWVATGRIVASDRVHRRSALRQHHACGLDERSALPEGCRWLTYAVPLTHHHSLRLDAVRLRSCRTSSGMIGRFGRWKGILSARGCWAVRIEVARHRGGRAAGAKSGRGGARAFVVADGHGTIDPEVRERPVGRPTARVRGKGDCEVDTARASALSSQPVVPHRLTSTGRCFREPRKLVGKLRRAPTAPCGPGVARGWHCSKIAVDAAEASAR